jgi:hypothetical protein
MHSLPWIGEKLAAEQPGDLNDIVSTVEKYLTNRQKKHVKVNFIKNCLQLRLFQILGVWEQIEPHEQEDYLDSLWSQIQNMQKKGWKETHISRYYSKFSTVFAETISHNLPKFVFNIIIP